MAVDSLDSCGVYFGTTGGQVYASADAGDSWAPIVRDLPAVLVGRGPDLAMIRVVLPQHLRELAQVGKEVELEVPGQATQRSVLDALEASYPVLEGHDPRPRDPEAPRRSSGSSPARRTCRTSSPDEPLPEAVARGAEPFFVVGAMAGG